MDDLVIELILIAMIIVPSIATSLQTARTTGRRGSAALERLRRGA